MNPQSFHRLESEKIVQDLNSNVSLGLSTTQINNLKSIYGANKLEEDEKPHIILRYIEQFKDPLILLLLGSAVLSVLVRQYEDAISIAAAVLIVGSVAFFQELKSEESLEALNTLVPLRCNVIRNGLTSNIDVEDVVPGDILKLQTGDRVPADARIIRCNGLFTDESTLTGESEPKEKTHNSLFNLTEDISISERNNIVFMGTMVTSGSAVAVVFATNTKTEFGKTFQEMKEIESRRTPLQVKMDELGKNLSIFSMGIIVCIGIIGVIQGKSFLSMFNIGVSLAVAAIPEGLPICVTVTLAIGVIRMAKRKAIVKKLPAVEALGCANYICCDKTGTLTQNKMTVIRIYCPALEDAFIVGSTLPSSSSSLFKNGDANYLSKNETKKLYASYNGHEIDTAKFPCLEQLLDSACLCNNSYAVSGDTFIGQPTEYALIRCATNLGLIDRRSSVKRIQESSFSSETKIMEVVCDDGHSTITHLKGAVETILPRCSTYLALNSEMMNFSKAAQERVLQQASEMSKDGLRILAVACGVDPDKLTLCGIVALMDPLRDGISEAVHRIQSTGAKVMMITGDAEETAISIAKMAGIYEMGVSRRVLSGREIEELSRNGDDVLSSVIEDVSVCYRTSPRHKLSIVRALQIKGHCVAMTGDGVNDAPALKSADIGIAVGSGTDCAKEAAAMIIIDDDFSTIVNAIEEGKSIFFNIKNFLTFQLSTSFAALSLVALNNLVGRPNPLNPMQILWINIIMDGPLAQSLGVEAVDTSVMQRPPRNRNEDIITRPLLMRVLTSGLLILIGTMSVFIYEMEDGTISSRDLTMTFTTFIMFDMFNALTCRHNTKSLFEISWVSNQAFLLAAAFSFGGQLLVLYFSPLQNVFKTTSLSMMDMIFVTLLASTMLLLDTVRKRHFPSVFTEVLPNHFHDKSGRKVERGVYKGDTFMV